MERWRQGVGVVVAAFAVACGPSATGPSASPGGDVTSSGEGGEGGGQRPTEGNSPGNVTVTGQFEVTVTTDRAEYGPGDGVAFTVEVCNRGGETTTEGGGGSDIPFSFVVRNVSGDVVADDTHAVHTAELLIVPWQPEQCRREHGDWDQTFWNRPRDVATQTPEVYGTPIRGEAVPRGDYVIEVHVVGGPATSNRFTLVS